ncbi:MAG TPA: HAMP domain-containing sensor histidine kinase [Planctomycetia bacterium]|nr:HAMP domain-containing sensor histidine kinase [Planctomycetia bacterium]
MAAMDGDDSTLAVSLLVRARVQPELAALLAQVGGPAWSAAWARFPDWPALLAALGNDASVIDADDRRSIRRAAHRQAAEKFRCERDLSLATDAASTLALAQTLAERDVRGAAAVWLVIAGGVGLVDGRVASAADIDWERSFLPGDYRRCIDLHHDGRLLGRLYHVEPADPELTWLPSLAAAIERLISRASVHDSGATSPAPPAAPADSPEFRAVLREFSAGAGHEINNPLGAIRGQAEHLLASEADPERRASLRKIQDQVERIGRMIRDLHLLGRAYQPARSPAALDSLVLDAAAAAGPILAAELTIEPIPAVRVQACRPELQRALAELVRNAATAAGPKGWVKVAASHGPAGAEIVITDGGPGFAALDREQAFTPFYCGRAAGRGLGMGLPVARRVIEDHGGTLHLGEGSPTTVTVKLPALVEDAARRVA